MHTVTCVSVAHRVASHPMPPRTVLSVNTSSSIAAVAADSMRRLSPTLMHAASAAERAAWASFSACSTWGGVKGGI